MRTLLLFLGCCFFTVHTVAHSADTLHKLQVSTCVFYASLNYSKETTDFMTPSGTYLKDQSSILSWEKGIGINVTKEMFKNWFVSIPFYYRKDFENFKMKYKVDDTELIDYDIKVQSDYFISGVTLSRKFKLYQSSAKNIGVSIYPFLGYNVRFLSDKYGEGTVVNSKNPNANTTITIAPHKNERYVYSDLLAGLMLEMKLYGFYLQPKFHIQTDNRDKREMSNSLKTKSFSTVVSLGIGF